ncbi:MAG: hypothetical protein C0404_07850 [Verrucomicrobia bacterium]|nr:hypothetical protein [Verrucomicrobiota bacterium]
MISEITMKQQLPAVLATLFVAAFAVHVFSNNKADVDLWGNVGFVRAMPWSQDFMYTNTFSFTDRDKAWTNHEWFSEYIFNRTFLFAGGTGLLALKVLLGLILLGILAASMKKDGVSGPVRALFLLLAISTISFGFSTRPHLFTYIFLASLIAMLKFKPDSRILWLIAVPLLGLVWTNLHGAFFIGIVLLLVFSALELIKQRLPSADAAAGERARHRIPVQLPAAGLLIAVSLINPYGSGLWSFIFASAAKPRPYLTEWAPFNLMQDFVTHADFIVLALVSLACIIFSGKRRNLTWLVVLALAFLSAMLMRRNIPLFAIVAALVVPEHVEGVAGRTLDRLFGWIPRPALALLLAGATCVSGWYAWSFNKTHPMEIEVPSDRFPISVFDTIRDKEIAGNALVFFDWAEYCIWHFPKCPVFLDGRFNDAYRNKTIDDYVRFLRMAPGWEKTITDYPVDIILIHRGLPVCAAMAANADWSLYTSNSIACLFLKKDRFVDLLSKAATAGGEKPSATSEALFP